MAKLVTIMALSTAETTWPVTDAIGDALDLKKKDIEFKSLSGDRISINREKLIYISISDIP